jgi:hypothetical protein
MSWARFLICSIGGAILIFVLDIWWHGTLAANMYDGYPQRPMAEIEALFPFLFLTYIIQLPMFAWFFLRLYPQRGMRNAMWWGIWGGFFVVIPNMQFFVAVKDTSWTILGMQVVEGIALCVLMAALFEAIYRPNADAGNV